MRDKDFNLLSEAYEKIYNNILINENLNSEYSSDTIRKADKFFGNLIKSQGGYFVDDDLKTYNIFKSHFTSEEENGKDIIKLIIKYVYYSSVGFGSSGNIGKPAGEKFKTYVIDDKGIVSLTEQGTGKKTSSPKVTFQRDENFKPKGINDFDQQLQVGDEREDIVIFEGENSFVSYGQYNYADKFKIEDKNIKLTAFVKKRTAFQTGQKIRLKYKITKTNVYKGELSYIINIIEADHAEKINTDVLKKDIQKLINDLSNKIEKGPLRDRLIKIIINHMHYDNYTNIDDLNAVKEKLIQFNWEVDNLQ